MNAGPRAPRAGRSGGGNIRARRKPPAPPMDRSPSGAVVAGTRAFAVALLAPVAARVGARPRVAADAAQALALSPGAGGVAVVEFAGHEALPGIERLVREGGGVRVLVAVPPEHATADEILRSLGVEPVR